ncbi:LPD7 domain-containing protein [Vibrio aerogenes]|uniref:LPD7 domain-containing protein n=1 Tax=Vibrio aerogenes TaxID=92172 RepID=UPI0021C366C6|nr:LPD7 domain-containing protein [Vibrio aerogenes]
MLVRVLTGKSGVTEYLVKGNKAGRALSRDELDERICIDGNLEMTDFLIQRQYDAGRTENYYHITLSFAEKDIEPRRIEAAYQQYKQSILAAYDSDEYHCYAEIHYPKVQSYLNQQTGERVERFPHVHMILPKQNLLSGLNFNPFGFYQSNVAYFSAIQEKINQDHGLISPYDRRREADQFGVRADLMSRYIGDSFKGANKTFRQQLLKDMTSRNIRTMPAFASLLAEYGEVAVAHQGKDRQYFKVRLPGKSQFIRLKDACFSHGFIVNRTIKNQKPGYDMLEEQVREWEQRKSREVKYIHAASPKIRQEYNAIHTAQEKEEYLHVKSSEFYARYRGAAKSDFQPRRRQSRIQSGAAFSASGRFTTTPVGLPGLSELHVAQPERRRGSEASELLHDHAAHRVLPAGAGDHHRLRRAGNGRRRRVAHSPAGRISHAAVSVPQNHGHSKVQAILNSYLQQNGHRIFRELSRNPLRQTLASHRREQFLLHSIMYKHYRHDPTVHPVQVFQFLQHRERQINMFESTETRKRTQEDRENSLAPGAYFTSYDELFKRIERQKHLQKELATSLENIVARQLKSADPKQAAEVEFFDKTTGDAVFKDRGRRIVMADKTPQPEHTAAALMIAAEKFGKVKVSGTEAFQEQVLDIAVAKDLNLVFANRDLQARFVALKKQHQLKQGETPYNTLEGITPESMAASGKHQQQNPESRAVKPDTPGQGTESQPDTAQTMSVNSPDPAFGQTVTALGDARYLHDEKQSMSFYVTFADGQTIWGAGLKDAVKATHLKPGDVADIQKTGTYTDVEVSKRVFREDGTFSHNETIAAKRADWQIKVLSRQDTDTIDSGAVRDQAGAIPEKASDKQPETIHVSFENTAHKTVRVCFSHQPDEAALSAIRQSDAFLRHYSVDEIKSGNLDRQKAGMDNPVNRVYDTSGNAVSVASNQAQVSKL